MSPTATGERLRETLRRLAEVEDVDLPILSVYLDVRPEASGQAPGRRTAATVLRDRLRAIEEAYWPRGDDYDSFATDRDRILDFVDGELDPATEGLAIFACAGRDLWEVVEAGAPFRNSVAAGPRPELFQLARLLDEHETAVVAVVDSNTARLFVVRAGRLGEEPGPDEDPESFRKRSMGGWSQARYQRHIDKHIADFADQTAQAIERLVSDEDARRVIVAGDEVAATALADALPEPIRERVGEVVRIGIRATTDDVAAEVTPILERLEAEAGMELADRVAGYTKAGGLGTLGIRDTKRALELGAVDTLVLAALPGDAPDRGGGGDARPLQEREDLEPDAPRALDLELRNELVRLATLTDADVEVVADHEAIDRAGGVGALLRYRPD